MRQPDVVLSTYAYCLVWLVGYYISNTKILAVFRNVLTDTAILRFGQSVPTRLRLQRGRDVSVSEKHLFLELRCIIISSVATSTLSPTRLLHHGCSRPLRPPLSLSRLSDTPCMWFRTPLGHEGAYLVGNELLLRAIYTSSSSAPSPYASPPLARAPQACPFTLNPSISSPCWRTTARRIIAHTIHTSRHW